MVSLFYSMNVKCRRFINFLPLIRAQLKGTTNNQFINLFINGFIYRISYFLNLLYDIALYFDKIYIATKMPFSHKQVSPSKCLLTQNKFG